MALSPSVFRTSRREPVGAGAWCVEDARPTTSCARLARAVAGRIARTRRILIVGVVRTPSVRQARQNPSNTRETCINPQSAQIKRIYSYVTRRTPLNSLRRGRITARLIELLKIIANFRRLAPVKSKPNGGDYVIIRHQLEAQLLCHPTPNR